ncbi:WecB/TagA/CpsF family glycosyltransferase [Thiohalobacter sp.]|uniref:WecB/TagA/CpsF family glycosyltransferase n=1 Tax=Thiohalobacter sp. TaxID=2025948 RepID=UPI002613D36A|nr:WecB/TagA/CpsF family glycosyltransferase [Thiohalobacter sp.]
MSEFPAMGRLSIEPLAASEVGSMSDYPRFAIVDCLVNRMDMPRALNAVENRLRQGGGGYICFSNVHTVVTSRNDPDLRAATNNSFLSLPDGRPLSLYARLCGYQDVAQVAGPDFMEHCLAALPGARHFFLGATENTLARLRATIEGRHPDAVIVGMYSPPFRPMTDDEHATIVDMIRAASPDFIWVGLGAPKQEKWMANNWEEFKPSILMGVGAAFDFHAGTVKRCPPWMRSVSLEWLYRLCREPRRLWKRYLVTNSLFLWYVASDALRGLARRKRCP